MFLVFHVPQCLSNFWGSSHAHGKLNSFQRRKYREKSTFKAEKIATGMQISEK